jgi:glycosyltransferase involved in cell wall biosynthesis
VGIAGSGRPPPAAANDNVGLNGNGIMSISCIIPTLNRGSLLGNTLHSLISQTISPHLYEIIIVDNGSTDGTRKISQRIIKEAANRQIRYIFDPEPGLLTGRHRGALEAKGELLVFVDDDIEAASGWLQAILETFRSPRVELVGGRNLPKFAVQPPAWLESFYDVIPDGGRSCSWLSLLDLGESEREIDPNYVWGLNFSIRRRALHDLGGFHPDCVPQELQRFQGDGETGLTMKARSHGYRAVYQPNATIYHIIPANRMTPEYFEQRAYFQGVCDSYSNIRREEIGESVDSAKVRSFPMRYARRIADCIVRSLKHLQHQPSVMAETTEVAAIRQGVHRAYQAGYKFHQSAVRSSPELLSWVLRNDYWDYRLPQPRHAAETKAAAG